jgi:hypothetical protein
MKQIFVVGLNVEGVSQPVLETYWADSHAEALGEAIMKRPNLRDLLGYEVITAASDPNGGVRDLIHRTYKWTMNPGSMGGGHYNRITTIKAVKDMTGWGLKEAKDKVDQVIKSDGLDIPF